MIVKLEKQVPPEWSPSRFNESESRGKTLTRKRGAFEKEGKERTKLNTCEKDISFHISSCKNVCLGECEYACVWLKFPTRAKCFLWRQTVNVLFVPSQPGGLSRITTCLQVWVCECARVCLCVIVSPAAKTFTPQYELQANQKLNPLNEYTIYKLCIQKAGWGAAMWGLQYEAQQCEGYNVRGVMWGLQCKALQCEAWFLGNRAIWKQRASYAICVGYICVSVCVCLCVCCHSRGLSHGWEVEMTHSQKHRHQTQTDG